MEPAGADYPVRPTRMCLSQIGSGPGAGLPDLATPLHQLDHVVVVKAQHLPQEVAGGGAERIRCIDDRAWFKVRHSERWRDAATRLSDAELRAALRLPPDENPAPAGRWWLGGAGWREAGSPDDFYEEIERLAEAEAKVLHRANEKGTHSLHATSRWLMPVEWDWKRLDAEAAYAWVRRAEAVVRHLIAESIRSGQTLIAEFEKAERQVYRIEATVRSDGGEGAFLAIATDRVYDPKVIAVLLAAVPGVPAEDWLPEPDGAAGIMPRPGQIIWSTLLTPQQTADLLALDDDIERAEPP
jgi:hypothetical protein